MKSWKKSTLLALLILILGIGLAACGDNDGDVEESDDVETEETEEAEGTESSDELSGEVTMWTASLAGDPFDSYFADLAEAFEELHPNLEVTIEDIPQDEIEQKVLTSLTGDDVPDVVNLAPRYSLNIAAQGGLLDLTDLLSDEVKNSYIEGPFDSGYYEDRLYAIPWYLTTTASWHNENHFDEAGITEVPENYQEVYEAAKKITEVTGKPSFFQSIHEGDVLMSKMMSLANHEPIVKDGKTVLQDNEKIVELFTLSQKMYEEGIMPQENVDGTFGTAQELFMSENISFLESGITFLGPIEEGAPDIYDVARAGQPFDDPDAPVDVAVMNFAIPAKTNNPDAAVALAEFVTNAENQLEFAKVAGTVLPSTEASLEDDYFQNPGDSPKALGMLEAAKSLERTEVLDPLLDNSPELREIVKTAYVNNLQGKLTPEEALQEIAEKWDASFEKEGIQPTF